MTRQMTTSIHMYLSNICIGQSTQLAIVRTCTCETNGRSSNFAYFNYLSLAVRSLKAEDQYTYMNKTSTLRNRIAFSNCHGSALETKTAQYIKRILKCSSFQVAVQELPSLKYHCLPLRILCWDKRHHS